MPAEKDLPITHVSAEPFQLESSDRFNRFKSRANIMGGTFGGIADREGASANERVYSSLFAQIVFPRLIWVSGRVYPLIVSRPKRKLIHQILGLDDVTRRMSRPFHPFVLQIKRNLGRAMPFVSDQEQFLAKPRFLFVADSFHFRDQ